MAPSDEPNHPDKPRQLANLDDRLQSFIAFWLVGGLTLLVLGILVFAVLRHAHRLGGVIGLLGIICLAIGLGIRQAARRQDFPDR